MSDFKRGDRIRVLDTDLTAVRSGLESVAEQLYMLEPFEYPLSGVAKVLETLRATVENLAGEVEKLTAKDGAR